MILIRFAISLFALSLLGMALSLSAAPDHPERHGNLPASPLPVIAG